MINYYNKDFRSIKSELQDYIKKYYPETYSDFNDASIGTMLLELVAYVGDKLAFNIDRVANERTREYAQEKASLYSLARTFNLKFPFKRAAATIIDFTVSLPVKGSGPDLNYMPLILRGAQALGAGQAFETLNDIDFSSPYSQSGAPNRIVSPNYNANGTIVSYNVTKREIAVNGRSKYFTKKIGNADSIPFLTITLPDQDVLQVLDVVTLPGTNYTSRPTISQLFNKEYRWNEVENLLQQEIFSIQGNSTEDGVKNGRWEKASQRFYVEYTDNGYLQLIFGGGMNAAEDYSSSYISDSSLLIQQLEQSVNMFSFGKIPDPNTTMFVKYRVGGGVKSNVGQNTLTAKGDINIIVEGPNTAVNSQVISSLSVNNPIPAIGGADELSLEEIRNLIAYNSGVKNSASQLKDYYALVSRMPGQFGAPFKKSVIVEDNKIKIFILNINADYTLKSESSTALKSNIKEWLANFRMINDYIEVADGKVINLSFLFNIYANPNLNKNELASEIINVVYNYLNVQNREIGEDIHMTKLEVLIGNIAGVISIPSYSVFNPVGGTYSLSGISQPLASESTREIDLLGQNTLFCGVDEMFEVKNKNTDIKIRFVN